MEVLRVVGATKSRFCFIECEWERGSGPYTFLLRGPRSCEQRQQVSCNISLNFFFWVALEKELISQWHKGLGKLACGQKGRTDAAACSRL